MANKLPSVAPYSGCVVYGPIWHSKELRNMVVIKLPTGRLTSTSYARYIVAVRIGRELTKDEEADHIDDNKQNDDPSNVQLLTKEENADKYNKIRPAIKVYAFNCKQCGLAKSVISSMAATLKKRGFAFCSRSCSTRYYSKNRVASIMREPNSGNLVS